MKIEYIISDSPCLFTLSKEQVDDYNKKHNTNYLGNENELRFFPDIIEMIKNEKKEYKKLCPNGWYDWTIDTMESSVYKNGLYEIIQHEEDGERLKINNKAVINLFEKQSETLSKIKEIIDDDDYDYKEKVRSIAEFFLDIE